MKKLITIVFTLALGTIFAQDANSDQNPNYAKSRDHYMQTYTQYTATQGTTKQDTYIPQENPNRLMLRHERKMTRMQMHRDIHVARANRPVVVRSRYGYGNNSYNNQYPSRYGRRGLGLGIRPYASTGIRFSNNGLVPYMNFGLGWGY